MRPEKLRLIAGFARLDELEGKTEARTAAVSDAPDPALRGVPGVDAEHPSVAVDHAIEVADNNTDVKSHQLRRFAHCLLLSECASSASSFYLNICPSERAATNAEKCRRSHFRCLIT